MSRRIISLHCPSPIGPETIGTAGSAGSHNLIRPDSHASILLRAARRTRSRRPIYQSSIAWMITP